MWDPAQGKRFDMSLANQNRHGVIKYLLDVVQNQRLELLDDMVSEDFTFNNLPRTLEQQKKWIRDLHKHLGTFSVEILQIIAEREVVAVHWRVNIAPSWGKSAWKVEGMNLITCHEGRAVSSVQVGGEALSSGTKSQPQPQPNWSPFWVAGAKRSVFGLFGHAP